MLHNQSRHLFHNSYHSGKFEIDIGIGSRVRIGRGLAWRRIHGHLLSSVALQIRPAWHVNLHPKIFKQGVRRPAHLRKEILQHLIGIHAKLLHNLIDCARSSIGFNLLSAYTSPTLNIYTLFIND